MGHHTTSHGFGARMTMTVFVLAGLALASPATAKRMIATIDTDDIQAWRVLDHELITLGGHILLVHAPQVVIIDIDPALLPYLLDRKVMDFATDKTIDIEPEFSISAKAGATWWNEMMAGGGRIASREQEDRRAIGVHDHEVYLPADVPPDLLERYDGIVGFRTAYEEQKARAGYDLRSVTGVGDPKYYTSDYMIGEIVIGAVLPESNGVIDENVEDWTESEVANIHSRIITAMERFQADCPMADLTLIFHFDDAPPAGGVAGTIDCDYEARNNESQARSDALTRLTYDGSPATRDYANHLRNLYDADWAFFFAVADNTVTGGGRAYAYLGGPLSQCYGHNSASVFQHETGHIFNAIDEYHPDAARSPTGRWGYLQVVNANSQYNDGTGFNGGAGEGQSALMVNNVNRHSAYSTGQIGWYDSNGDGVPDILESYPTPDVQLDDASAGIASLSGAVSVNPVRSQRSGFNVGFSTCEIAGAQWRIEGHAWQPADAVDGVFDEGVENITITTPALPDGSYIIEVTGTNTLGVATQRAVRIPVDIVGSPIANAAPFATFDTSLAIQRVGYDVTFDAVGCSDLETESAALQVRWDFDDDGTWDTSYAATKTATHAYSTDGLYAATVEVIDGAMNTTTCTGYVLVTTDNVAPVADVVATTGNIHGTFSPTYVFDATGSIDPEGTALEIRWDWDANGSYDTSWSTDLTGEHTYTLDTTNGGRSKQWTVIAQIRDGDGATTTVAREIWSCPYNSPPVLSGSVDPAVASTDTVVIFDMNASTDADIDTTWDGLLEYRYDWDGDGNWDTDMLPEPVAFHNYPETGTYDARVQIRDRFSAMDEDVFTIEVGEDPVPQPFVVTGGSIEPEYTLIAPEATFAFQADLDYLGTPGDLSVTWYVDNIEGGDTTSGTITSDGLYTAPVELGYHQIKAVSNDNPGIAVTSGANVMEDFVFVTPYSFDLVDGQTVQLTATTGFAVDPTVTWSINDIIGGHPLLGTIDETGLFAAPTGVYGSFPVFVQATSNEDPTVSSMVYGTISSADLPTADFAVSETTGDAPFAVDFTAITTGTVTEWTWDFDDDGEGATGATAQHVFDTPGLYTITLDVGGPGGTASHTKVAHVQVNGGTAPLVDFEAPYNPVYTCPPYNCAWSNFYPVTVGEVTSYDWNFAGLFATTEETGTWPEPPVGDHTVSLTVTGPGGSTTKTKTDYLHVQEGQPVDFAIYGSSIGPAPLSVEFVAKPSEFACAYDWSFGNGGVATGPNPTHTFTEPGWHAVTLVVEFGGFGGTISGHSGGYCDELQGYDRMTGTVTKEAIVYVAGEIPATSPWGVTSTALLVATIGVGVLLCRRRPCRPRMT